MKADQYWENFRKRLSKDGIFKTGLYYTAVLLGYDRTIATWEGISKKIPVQNVLVFECESDMDDNARALYEYLCQKGYQKKYRMVWIVQNLEYCRQHFARENVRFVSRTAHDTYEKMCFIYYVAVAKFFFFTHPYWLKSWRKEQIVINLGHGIVPIKASSGNKDLEKTFTYRIAASEAAGEIQKKYWNMGDEKLILLGSPRNDLLYTCDRNRCISPFFSVKEGEKIIIAMPTFKQTKNWVDSDVVDPFYLSVVENENQFGILNDILREEHCHLLVKVHPLQRLDFLVCNNMSNIHYLTNDDLLKKDVLLYELIGCCDAMLSDFSSVVFDFLLLDKPLGFLLNHMEDYSRGFSMENPLNYMPGHRIMQFSDLLQFIYDVNRGIDSYMAQRKGVRDYFNKFQDNNNSKRIVEYFKL